MCRNITKTEDKELCWHCGNIANPTDGWEHGWPNTGKINLGKDSCILDYLWGYDNDKIGFKHPAMKGDNGYQEINFEWNPNVGYRLCRDCQGKIITVIGNFFKKDKIKNEKDYLIKKSKLILKEAKK